MKLLCQACGGDIAKKAKPTCGIHSSDCVVRVCLLSFRLARSWKSDFNSHYTVDVSILPKPINNNNNDYSNQYNYLFVLLKVACSFVSWRL